MATKHNIRKSLKALSLAERKVALKLLDSLNIDLSEGDASLTGTKPRGFWLEERFYPADYFRDIFLKVCEIAASKNRDKLNLFLEMEGTKRKYFSSSYNDLSDDYRKINGTSIYAELNENATTLKKRCEQVIVKFGMDLSSFRLT